MSFSVMLFYLKDFYNELIRSFIDCICSLYVFVFL